jgi:alkaline phosphatase
LLIVTADHECGGLGIEDEESLSYLWETTGHTATDVPLNAMGPGSDLLAGDYENTHVFDAMAETLGVE